MRVYLCARSAATGDCYVTGGSTLAPATLLSYAPPSLASAVTSSLLAAPLSAADAAACPVCAATFLTCAPARALLTALGSAYTCPDTPLGADPAAFDRYTRQRRTIATDEVQENAEQLSKVIKEKAWDARIARLRQMQAIASDPVKVQEFLTKTSMISGLRKAQAIQ